MATMLNWLRSSSNDTTSTDAATQRGLPAIWYRSPELYELERRAIFSKKWLLATHKLRFTRTGDFLRITQAGYSFILCLDKTSQIRGFHNICRHRGFPIVHTDSGNAKIFACKYHGWSYGIGGNLAKAPHFENFPDFQKQDNGLLPIHVHVDALGFVWVNLEATKQPSISWDEQFAGIDVSPRFTGFDFADYRFDHAWQMDGDYNWKTLADNYNECLHCLTAHPDTVGVVDVTSYRVEGNNWHLQHFNKRQEDGLNKGKLEPHSTYYFPNACMTVTEHFFYMMRCVPVSANKCSMEYEVYRHNAASDHDFETIDATFKRVLSEDKWLCNETQRNLETGVYVNGPLHPQYESGPLFFQSRVKEAIQEHRALEERKKTRIYPAVPAGRADSSDDIAFCEGLSCNTRSDLVW